MRDGIIYDCPNANCRTPIYTGKCSKACIEKYNKEMGIKPKTNADRIRAMSDGELVKFMEELGAAGCPDPARSCRASCTDCMMEWLQQPAEGE